MKLKRVEIELNNVEDLQRFFREFKDMDVNIGSKDRKYDLPVSSFLWLTTLDLSRPIVVTLNDTNEDVEKEFDEKIKKYEVK